MTAQLDAAASGVHGWADGLAPRGGTACLGGGDIPHGSKAPPTGQPGAGRRLGLLVAVVCLAQPPQVQAFAFAKAAPDTAYLVD